MKIKLKAEKKKLLGLIRTRTPQNLLLSLEIGRGLGIERWVECAWVRECLEIHQFTNKYYWGWQIFTAYHFCIIDKVPVSFTTGMELKDKKTKVFSIDTSIGGWAFGCMTYKDQENIKNIPPQKLRSLIQEWFVNYIKYILPHEL